MASNSSTVGLQDTFPKYFDGDVKLVLSPGCEYNLHARTLRMHSTLFGKLLPPENAIALSSRARKEGVKTQYRIELQTTLDDNDQVGTLVSVALDDHARPLESFFSFAHISFDGGFRSRPILKNYDNVLRAYYYQPIRISDSSTDGFAAILQDLQGLADVADYLGSMKVVSLPIDNVLVKQGQVLWKSISRNPVDWANLSMRVESELVFRESITHLVGQWPRLMSQAMETFVANPDNRTEQHATDGSQHPYITLDDIAKLDPLIRTLVQRKHSELDEVKRAIEARIMGHYPEPLRKYQVPAANSLTSTKKNAPSTSSEPKAAPTSNSNLPIPRVGPGGKTIRGGPGVPVRAAAYGADVPAWMALVLFRHWCGQQICMGNNRYCADGGYSFYMLLHTRGYIDHGTIEGFCCLFPMSARMRAAFEQEVAAVRCDIAPFVERLVRDELLLDRGQEHRAHVQYLTCTELGRDDLPWLADREKAPDGHGLAGSAGSLSALARHTIPQAGHDSMTGQDHASGAAQSPSKKRKTCGSQAGMVQVEHGGPTQNMSANIFDQENENLWK